MMMRVRSSAAKWTKAALVPFARAQISKRSAQVKAKKRKFAGSLTRTAGFTNVLAHRGCDIHNSRPGFLVHARRNPRHKESKYLSPEGIPIDSLDIKSTATDVAEWMPTEDSHETPSRRQEARRGSHEETTEAHTTLAALAFLHPCCGPCGRETEALRLRRKYLYSTDAISRRGPGQ